MALVFHVDARVGDRRGQFLSFVVVLSVDQLASGVFSRGVGLQRGKGLIGSCRRPLQRMVRSGSVLGRIAASDDVVHRSLRWQIGRSSPSQLLDDHGRSKDNELWWFRHGGRVSPSRRLCKESDVGDHGVDDRCWFQWIRYFRCVMSSFAGMRFDSRLLRLQRQSSGHRAALREYSDGHLQRCGHVGWHAVSDGGGIPHATGRMCADDVRS